ncbi:MAG: hypothetical protein KDD42_00325 [Bdellovibrionales bacterium]|nr:hypothetical protein [Bdellovibrionales bacterium]
MSNVETQLSCFECGANLSASDKFCSQCGKSRSASSVKKISLPQLGGMMLFGGILWLGISQMQSSLAGTAPTQHYSPEVEVPSELNDPVIQRLRNHLKANPEDLAGWTALTERLMQITKDANQPSNQVVFEIIEALGKIIELDPKNAAALMNMAEISFTMQAFGKAAEFYMRYLELNPKDLDVRAKYASSLSFIGKASDAEEQLQMVLKENPKHFHALAYLTITYAQMGEPERAKTTGAQALENAPSEEARVRLSQFIEKIGVSTPESQVEQEASGSIERFVKNNPVSGSHFVGSKRAGDVMKLYFKSFPMSAMPPFAKEKFFGKLKEEAKQDSQIKVVEFYDEDTDTMMDRIVL